MKTKKQFIRVTEQDTNKPAVLVRDVQHIKNHNKRFVKVYADLFPILPNLTFYELQILIYIISNLKMKSKTITLKPSLFAFHRQTYYKAIKGLIEWDIITPKPELPNIYNINTDYYFKGVI